MRTIVYVDGYNLFYSLLTKSRYKWLDLVRLFESCLLRNILLPGADKPARFELVQLKYFTAPILGRLAKDPAAPDRQAHYHRALKSASGDRLEIISGFHLAGITTGFPIVPLPELERLKVQVMEEKQTDVNIALHMYRDAVQDRCDCAVLCSNDSDLEPVLQMIREDFPEKVLGLVLPRKAANPGGRKSGRLTRHAHWVRHQIQETELQACQFPDRLLDHRKRTIRRPESW
jgi:uncharacterized LabA/DUF88 family protein